MRDSQLSLLISTLFLIAGSVTDNGFMLVMAAVWLVLSIFERYYVEK